jgi:hypothetical protein
VLPDDCTRSVGAAKVVQGSLPRLARQPLPRSPSAPQARRKSAPCPIRSAVAALGAGVDDLKIGDAVFGVLEVGREGAYAEKLAVRRRAVRQQSSPNAARPSRAWRAHLLIAWSG